MDELLTTLDAAKQLGRSVERVRDYEREGRLPAQKTRSGQRLFKASDVERLAQRLGSKMKKAPAILTPTPGETRQESTCACSIRGCQGPSGLQAIGCMMGNHTRDGVEGK